MARCGIHSVSLQENIFTNHLTPCHGIDLFPSEHRRFGCGHLVADLSPLATEPWKEGSQKLQLD